MCFMKVIDIILENDQFRIQMHFEVNTQVQISRRYNKITIDLLMVYLMRTSTGFIWASYMEKYFVQNRECAVDVKISNYYRM